MRWGLSTEAGDPWNIRAGGKRWGSLREVGEYQERASQISQKGTFYERDDQQEGQAKKKKSSLQFPTRKVLCMSTSAFDSVLNCNSYIQNEPERFHCLWNSTWKQHSRFRLKVQFSESVSAVVGMWPSGPFLTQCRCLIYHVISTLFNILLSAKLPVSFW